MRNPSWLPEPYSTHGGRLLALARCIHQMHLRDEVHVSLGHMRTFDSLCVGPLELVADVLQQAGFTIFLDEIPRRSRFVCEPEAFAAIATSRRAQGLDVEMVKDAVKRLSDEGFGSSPEIDRLAEMLRAAG